MKDDWQGEHFIRSKPKTKAARVSDTQSVVQSLVHAKRRKNGVGQGQLGGYWARSIHAAAVHANILGGKDD